jgi:release factor glutamine methyltransferase
MTVYMPAEDSHLMLEALRGYEPKTALDMGTGSGILAIALAKMGCSVTAADINPEAIEYARKNAKAEGVKIEFVVSDLFKKISGKFDLMVFNPPYVRTADAETADMQSIAWAGGKDGMAVINRFLKQAKDFLKPGGKILLLASSTDEDLPEMQGYATKLLKEKRLFFERLFVFELSQ